MIKEELIMDKDWLNDLEQNIKDTLDEKTTPVTQAIGIKSEEKTSERHNFMENITKNENTTIVMIIIALAAITYFVWQNKQQNMFADSSPMNIPNKNLQDYSSVPPWYNKQLEPQDELQRKYEAIDAAAKKIWERTKWNTDKLILLSTINNNNVSVMQNNYPKSELVYLNPDWTISKMPKAIKLDEEDRLFLQKFLR